jgi:hypothetical protein
VRRDGERRFLERLRAAFVQARARPWTLADVLACGCEPDFQHCADCDRRRADNARWEEAVRIVQHPENGAVLLAIIDRLEREGATSP